MPIPQKSRWMRAALTPIAQTLSDWPGFSWTFAWTPPHPSYCRKEPKCKTCARSGWLECRVQVSAPQSLGAKEWI